ncbi:Mitochondrial distribution and morphology protein 12 [Rhizophlyctis rosea]|nr:Mitochondrial distribution and morphology protein 12 [Rhizophlyctis rosea]
MSFIIAWELLNDGEDAARLRTFLNNRFASIQRPPFIGNMEVTDLDFGDEPPDLTIKDICDPLPEFYLPDDYHGWNPRDTPPDHSPPGSSYAASSEEQTTSGRGDVSGLGHSREYSSDIGGGMRTSMEELRPWGATSYRDNLSGFVINGSAGSEAGTRSTDSRRVDGSDHFSYAASVDGRANPPTVYSEEDNHQLLRHRHKLDRNLNLQHSTPPPPFRQTHSLPPTPPAFKRNSYGLGLGLGISPATPGPASNNTSYFPPQPYPHHHHTSSPAPSSSPASMATPAASGADIAHPEYFIDHPRHSIEQNIAVQYAQARRRESDAQIELNMDYKGNMRLVINTQLIVNFPTPNFMVLPLTLTLTGFSFQATAVIAHLGDRINFCFRDPGAGESVLHDVSIDSEIGDKNRQVLKNVGRIEKFILEQLRKLIEDYFVFPNSHCISLQPQELDPESEYDDDFDDEP